jgi:hypothetical protein
VEIPYFIKLHWYYDLARPVDKATLSVEYYSSKPFRKRVNPLVTGRYNNPSRFVDQSFFSVVVSELLLDSGYAVVEIISQIVLWFDDEPPCSVNIAVF